MKNPIFRSVIAAVVLAVGFVACTPIQQSTGDSGYYDVPPTASTPNRIWVDDPYRPGASILMERDPYSGRYYPVSNGAYNGNGGIYTTPAPYGAYRDPYYRSGSRPRYRQGARSYPVQQPTPQQQEQVRREGAQKRQEAANQILRPRQ